MTEPATAAHTIVVQQEMPHAPEKVWRALTESPLMAQWLMQNDFEPVVGRRFQFRAEPMPQWNGVTDCEVLTVEPQRRLSYSWNSSGDEAANGLRTVVTWTLTPTSGGTLLRMEHTGFRPEDENFQKGAGYGWKRMVATLEQVVAGLR
jgi:uncharacterized protein YndB with AHSA1/START domain